MRRIQLELRACKDKLAEIQNIFQIGIIRLSSLLLIYRVRWKNCNNVKHHNYLICLNFIEWKQKMSEIQSNFRISLNFFELATFGTNYGLQTVNETFAPCPKVALRYFVTLVPKRFLEVIDTLVFFSASLAFRNAPGTIVQRIGIRRFWRPLCGGNEARNLIF